MQVIFIFLSLLISFLILTTFSFWGEQKRLKKRQMIHRNKKLSKFDLIEVSSKDRLFDEYYEPKIVEVLPNKEG